MWPKPASTEKSKAARSGCGDGLDCCDKGIGPGAIGSCGEGSRHELLALELFLQQPLRDKIQI